MALTVAHVNHQRAYAKSNLLASGSLFPLQKLAKVERTFPKLGELILEGLGQLEIFKYPF